MLRLIHIATNLEFEIPRDSRIPFYFSSPILEEQGSTTYSATMSGRSAVNRRLTSDFKRVGKPDNSGAFIPVWLELGGQRKRCTMRILEADRDTIKYNLLFDEGSFVKQFGDVVLNDLDMGTGTIPSGEMPAWTDDFHKKTYPEVKAAFPPIYNTAFFDGSSYETDYGTDSGYLNRPFSMQVGGASNLLYPYAPQPFLNSVIDGIFKSNGFAIKENFMLESSLKNLLILNNVSNSKVDVNFNNGSYVDNEETKTDYNVSDHVPSLTIKDFLKSLRNKFNVIAFVDESNGTVRLVNFDEILKTPADEDLSEDCYFLQLSGIPSYTGVNFLASGEQTPAFEAEYVDFKSFDGKLVNKGNPIDKSDLPTITGEFVANGVYVFRPEDSVYKFFGDEYFQLKYNETSGDYEWIRLGYSDIGSIYADNEDNVKVFESSFGVTFSSVVGVTMADYERQGISELLEANPDKNFGIIAAFFRPSNATYPYPEASFADAKNINDIDYLLYNGNENGTVDKFFKNTVEFYLNKGRTYKTMLQLSAAKLLNFDFSKKYNIHGGKFMVKNIKGDFTMKGVDYKSAELVEV